jgi:hypothetical protein
MMFATNISEFVKFNVNPLLSVMKVLKTTPSDSLQLTVQNETRAMRKNVDTDRCSTTVTRRREKKRPETTSNGISRIK